MLSVSNYHFSLEGMWVLGTAPGFFGAELEGAVEIWLFF